MQQNWRLYNLLNNVVGWVTFVIAAVVYLMTIGPSASLWDCPEFILSAFKLEVGHPPGAPIYMLVYNVAAHLAPTPELAGLYTNALSGLLSAGTILLLFWTITHLVRRVVLPGASPCAKQLVPERVMPVPTLAQTILIMGSGLVGALLYTFTDTFWYSAVESEVYAFSSFLTALVFWLMLKWSDRADNDRSDRWIVLIAYVMGLSIGVHLLNLLCIPAMALIYYFRKHDTLSFKGIVTTLIVSFVLIAVIMFGIMQGVVAFGGTIDRWVVNGLKMPYNSGFYLYLAVLMVVLVGSLTLYPVSYTHLDVYKRQVFRRDHLPTSRRSSDQRHEGLRLWRRGRKRGYRLSADGSCDSPRCARGVGCRSVCNQAASKRWCDVLH